MEMPQTTQQNAPIISPQAPSLPYVLFGADFFLCVSFGKRYVFVTEAWRLSSVGY